MRLCDLRLMEVINQSDCKRLGFVSDVDIDICKGTIDAIIIPGSPKIFGMFGIDKEYVIPSRCIIQIGVDIILVDVNIEEVYVSCKY